MVKGRVILLLCLAVLLLSLERMAISETLLDPGPLASSRLVVIPQGGVRIAADSLQKNGAIGTRVAFFVQAWLSRAQGPLQAGDFLIPAHASIAQILNILRHGAPVQSY